MIHVLNFGFKVRSNEFIYRSESRRLVCLDAQISSSERINVLFLCTVVSGTVTAIAEKESDLPQTDDSGNRKSSAISRGTKVLREDCGHLVGASGTFGSARLFMMHR